MIETLDTDYLVVGAGAMSMAFADVILQEDKNAHIVMADRRPAAGGHWTDAYPFVRLHQPALFYGLNSTKLGSGGTDLASGPEIVAYYDRAMRRFVASGRLRFLPMCEYRGEGRVTSVLDPDRGYQVHARRRIVDGTYLEARVPSTQAPRYEVDQAVAFMPLNGLTRLRKSYEQYVIVGAGKTGIDAALFLLDNGVPATRITWITPNDSWLWDRGTVQGGDALATIRVIFEHAVDAPDATTAFLELERKGIVLRLDSQQRPTKWRCATIERAEAEQLRLIEDVVRLGRVKRVGTNLIELESGSVEIAGDSLVIDCSTNGLTPGPVKPIWGSGTITLQSVFMCQQTTSAAMQGRVELLNISDERRNRMLKPVAHPEWADDVAATLAVSVRNVLAITPLLPRWLRGSRVYLGSHTPLPTYLVEAGRMALALRRHAA